MRVVWLRFRPASRRCSSVCWHRGSPPSQAAYGCVEGDLSAVRNSLPLVSSSFSRLDFLYYLSALYNTPCYSKTCGSRLSSQETTTKCLPITYGFTKRGELCFRCCYDNICHLLSCTRLCFFICLRLIKFNERNQICCFWTFAATNRNN